MLDLRNGQSSRPSMKLQLQRLKDQYPGKKPVQLMEVDENLPQGQAPALGEMAQAISEPTGTPKEFQEKKQSYKDIQYGQPKRGR